MRLARKEAGVTAGWEPGSGLGRSAGPAFLTCWVKAACGDDGDLLGAPRALSGFESQDLSLESGSRGVCARPKPSSASAMVRPGPEPARGSILRTRDRVGECVATSGTAV